MDFVYVYNLNNFETYLIITWVKILDKVLPRRAFRPSWDSLSLSSLTLPSLYLKSHPFEPYWNIFWLLIFLFKPHNSYPLDALIFISIFSRELCWNYLIVKQDQIFDFLEVKVNKKFVTPHAIKRKECKIENSSKFGKEVSIYESNVAKETGLGGVKEPY